jgi:hypothetical protein
MNDPRAPASTLLLKKVLLDLYAKSGHDKVLSSTAYSDNDKNTKSIRAPNMSFLGDTTPDKFYGSITNADIADGLIPRLQIVEYTGDRTPRNRNAGHAPPPQLSSRFADVVMMALTMGNNHACAPVQYDVEGLGMLDAFDEECDAHMRGNPHSGEVQLWNRAHLKALKMAALLAVGCNPHAPIITGPIAQWAIEFTRTGTMRIVNRFHAGDVGTGDDKLMAELRRMVREYYELTEKQLKGYRVPLAWCQQKVVPYGYLIVRATRIAAFYNHRLGATAALRNTLETALQAEVLTRLTPNLCEQHFNTRQALYARGQAW